MEISEMNKLLCYCTCFFLQDTDELAVLGERKVTRCPITQQVMKCPMKNKHCGHCYDRMGVLGLITNRAEKARWVEFGLSYCVGINLSYCDPISCKPSSLTLFDGHTACRIHQKMAIAAGEPCILAILLVPWSIYNI